jgi:DNA polymerase III delta subunit
MLYILYGQDDFSLNQAVKEIKAGLGDWEMVATSTTILEGQHLTLGELRNKCGARMVRLSFLYQENA